MSDDILGNSIDSDGLGPICTSCIELSRMPISTVALVIVESLRACFRPKRGGGSGSGSSSLVERLDSHDVMAVGFADAAVGNME